MLVQEDGKPVGVLTRQDLLAFLSALTRLPRELRPRVHAVSDSRSASARSLAVAAAHLE